MGNLRYYLSKKVLSMFGVNEEDCFTDDTEEEKKAYQKGLEEFGVEANEAIIEATDGFNKISQELDEYIKGLEKD